MASKLKKSDRFNKSVKLYMNDRLGAGTFGMVCKASCDQLECAAKLLHPRYFDVTEDAETLQKFYHEYDILEQLYSPYIIQYLGRWIDPETHLPVLLMELMDENLTAFLKRHQGKLPYNIQVDICSDVAQALAYLHSNNIIHRDLSSNNVLMFAGRRAKVSDFGMSKLIPQNEGTKLPHTLLAGSDPYMPPEASSPHYTGKLDAFSFGVLTLQIVTGKFPNPGPMVVIPDRMKPPQVVAELERRNGDISLAPPNNKLLKVTLSCIQDMEDDRPTADNLCVWLRGLKAEQDYEQLSMEEPFLYSSTEVQNKEKRSGTLLKLTQKYHLWTRWRAFFFKATTNEISYFSVNDRKHTVPRGLIKIEDVVNIDFPAVRGATFPIAIYFRGKSAAKHNSPWILNADSEEERSAWMVALKPLKCRTSDYETLQSGDQSSPYTTLNLEYNVTTPLPARAMSAQPPLPPRNASRKKVSHEPELYEPMKDISSISFKVLVTEEDDVYEPRPEWAKAVTDPKKKPNEDISAMQLEALYISRSTITDLVSICQGEFGQVFKASLNKGSPKERVVVVKTIKKTLEADQKNFLREMSVMSNLMHPNIVRLHGIVIDEYDLSPWIVLEYLPRGDLKTFLTENERAHHKLLQYMLDVAMGMHYIFERGLVHRDLAARNILVGDNEVCKVSDFGLLRELPKGDALYQSQSDCPWPIRWMAPESLSDRLFSQATDVWSFGVLQWEMFNPKDIPYKAVETNQQVGMKLAEGYRMPTPRGCPPVVARMMKACWHKVPEKRPSFLVISSLLMKEL